MVDNLHLKSPLTHFTSNTLVAVDNAAGRGMVENINAAVKTEGEGAEEYSAKYFENERAANILRVNGSLWHAEECSECAMDFAELSMGVQNTSTLTELEAVSSIIMSPNSEMHQVDGALTCRSLLLSI